jgi:hypothetical protein
VSLCGFIFQGKERAFIKFGCLSGMSERAGQINSAVNTNRAIKSDMEKELLPRSRKKVFLKVAQRVVVVWDFSLSVSLWERCFSFLARDGSQMTENPIKFSRRI